MHQLQSQRYKYINHQTTSGGQTTWSPKEAQEQEKTHYHGITVNYKNMEKRM